MFRKHTWVLPVCLFVIYLNATLAPSPHFLLFRHCSSLSRTCVGWSTTLVQAEISQHFLEGLQLHLVQIAKETRGWILMTSVILWLWLSTSKLTFVALGWHRCSCAPLGLRLSNFGDPLTFHSAIIRSKFQFVQYFNLWSKTFNLITFGLICVQLATGPVWPWTWNWAKGLNYRCSHTNEGNSKWLIGWHIYCDEYHIWWTVFL